MNTNMKRSFHSFDPWRSPWAWPGTRGHRGARWGTPCLPLKVKAKFPQYQVNHFRAYGSVAFGAFMLCHYHFYRVSKCFHHSKRKPHTHQAVALPLPLETTYGLSVSRLTCFGGISYQWNHRLYIHCAWLLSLSMTFGFLPCQSTYRFFTPFHGWVTPRCVYPSRLVYPLIRWWIRGASLWLQWPVLLGTLVYR